MKPKTHKELLLEWRARKFSWSQFSSFDYNKEGWYQSYFLQKRGTATQQMDFGNTVGQSFATDKPMADIVRYSEMEYCLEPKLGNIPLTGYFDSYDPKGSRLREYKTSSNTTKWNQKSVDEHRQLDWYCMLLFLAKGIRPESVEIHLEYIAVEQGNDFQMRVVNRTPKVFKTKRTMRQILKLMSDIRRRRKEMEAYIATKKPLFIAE